MANKRKNRKSKTKVAPGPSHQLDLERFKTMVIIALIAIITGISAAFFAEIFSVRNRVMTDEQQAYLKVFPELASNFASELGTAFGSSNINSERETRVKMTDYGISDTDGAFYIDFAFVYIDEASPEAQFNFLNDSNAYPDTAPVHKGTVYFWEDQENPGHYSYAFSYEN